VKTTIDALKFRTLSGPFAILEALRPCLGFIDQDLLTLSDQAEGMDGWQFRRSLMIAGDVVMGHIDFGGDHMRGVVRVSIPGSGCAWVQDWDVFERLPKVLEKASIMRLDIALTTYQGEVTHERVIAAHEARQFCTGGRHPHRRVIEGSDPHAGKTVYVGNRKSAKFLRAYEKGWEMLKDYPVSVREMIASMGGRIQVDGVGHVEPHKVYRVEVEFKDEDRRTVPWEAIGKRDEYFAGAYPFCAALLPGVPETRIKAIPEAGAKLALASALDHCRRSYGATIRAAVMAYGGDLERVMGIITSEKPADQLIAAGVLLVNHAGARETA
jgi:phage replication initiation protein